MTSLNDGPVRAISAPGRKPLIVLTGAAHLMVRGAHACVCGSARPHVTQIQGGHAGARSKLGGERATKTRGTLGARIVRQRAINPTKKVPALVRAGIVLAEDTRFELVRA